MSTKTSRPDLEDSSTLVKKSLLSIDYESESSHPLLIIEAHFYSENIEMADYVKEGDVGFRKPKVRNTLMFTTSEVEADQPPM